MRIDKSRVRTFAKLAGILVFVVSFSVGMVRAQESVLHNFNGAGGASPGVSLVADSAGNLYGTTNAGGASGTACGGVGCGTVFELSPVTGGWKYRVLHSFGSGTDGQIPNATLAFDSSGNLYGDTYQGGTNGAGTLFTLIPQSNGTWREKVIYNFTAGSDGGYPQAVLTMDSSGNIFGTASGGGIQSTNCPYFQGCGVVFEFVKMSQSRWREKVLYTFAGPPDGWSSLGGVVFDSEGNLYGTTSGGGQFNAGTVFELTPGARSWTETLIHSFNLDGTDGAFPVVGLVADNSGNLYGTTVNGGSSTANCSGFGCGIAFEFVKGSGGSWTEKVLHSFTGGTIGGSPGAALVFDTAGNLYSTAITGGLAGGCGGAGCGTVFELSPNASGPWHLTVLHTFGTGTDGTVPYGGVVFNTDGNLYGTTNQGGSGGMGTLFQLIP
jgi:uncharacterized repeat protein (TIGR03803 family)